MAIRHRELCVIHILKKIKVRKTQAGSEVAFSLSASREAVRTLGGKGPALGSALGLFYGQRGKSGPFQLEDDLGIFQGVLTV